MTASADPANPQGGPEGCEHDTSRPAGANGSADGHFGTTELTLYALTVVTWSSSWLAMKFQVGTVPIFQSVLYRFAIAALIMVAWVLLTRRNWRFPLWLHARFALMGVLMFSLNFVLFYGAAQWLTSGLLAVVFSLVTILNPLNAAILLRDRIEPRVLIGAAFGIGGIALIFWPEVSAAENGRLILMGLGLAVSGALSFSLGNIVASGVHRHGLPVISVNAWGIFYGVVFLATVVTLTGAPLQFDTGPVYVWSMLFLATASTVIPMASYLTLMRRIGPGRAGYATVMFPIGALAISWAFEGYQWTWPALVGLALALVGNLFVLRQPRRRP